MAIEKLRARTIPERKTILAFKAIQIQVSLQRFQVLSSRLMLSLMEKGPINSPDS